MKGEAGGRAPLMELHYMLLNKMVFNHSSEVTYMAHTDFLSDCRLHN